MKTVLELVADRAASDIARIFPENWSSPKAGRNIRDLVAYALAGVNYRAAVRQVRAEGEPRYPNPLPFMDAVPDHDGEFSLGVAIRDAFDWLQFELVACGGVLTSVSKSRHGPTAMLVRTRLDVVRSQTIEDPNKRAFTAIVLATDHGQLLDELELLADLKGSWELSNFEYALAGDGDAIGVHVTVDPEDRFRTRKRRRWAAPSVDVSRKRSALSDSMAGVYNPSYESRVWVPLLRDEQDWWLEQWPPKQ
ncbi:MULTISPECIES: hypothetical protein [Stenotrophomonas]|jgi:hypothetical protein|uniref:hypothetical protein n=1 Tax=Stenotrophomonas TaxID=40323 RepID=UPI0021CA1802|nr:MULTISPECIES: hypothetical protein [Stenotrophomonas]MCX2919441.1 hypothetical protein [Stenotrophomonas rhizophila]